MTRGPWILQLLEDLFLQIGIFITWHDKSKEYAYFFSSPEVKDPCLKGFQVSSNEGPSPFERGYNSENTLTNLNYTSSPPEPMAQLQPKMEQSILG